MIKAIFFDIDGTLISFKTHKLSQSTILALSVLRQKGIKVFIATGRHPWAINNLGTQQFDGYVTINGGYCLIDNQVIFRKTIAPHEIMALLDYLQNKESFPVVFVQEKELFINYYNDDVHRIFELLNFPNPAIKPVEEALKEPIFQVISFFNEEQEKLIMPYLQGCETTRWNPLFTDIVPKGGCKSLGIDKIIEHLDIRLDETMAFGDGGNDIDMLQHVGLGVAMGNANEEVKKVADYVTDSVDEDGIYKALLHFNIISGD